MKKLVAIIAVAFLGVNAASAQEYVWFGAKGGLNFSNMSSDGFRDNNTRTGFHLGLVAEIPVGDRFSVQPEVLYSTQGTDALSRAIPGETPFQGEYKLDYIQVPVMAKFYIFDGLAIEAGPSFNFLVNEEIMWAGVTNENIELASTFEFGGAAGLSYKFTNGFFASARYTQGFTDAFDSDNWSSGAVNNTGVQLGVGLMF